MLLMRRVFLFMYLLAAVCTSAAAFEVSVVDQHGNPLADAFVAIPSGEIGSPNEAAAVMDQIDVQFVPHVLAIDQGQSVVFPNSDNIRHHVYSFSDPKRFEIKLYQGVPNQPVKFDQPGLVALGCNIHDDMLAYIYVSPWPHYAVTDQSGIVHFELNAPEIAVWHPWLKAQAPERFDISELDENSSVTITLQVVRPQATKTFKNTRRRYDD